MSKGVFGRALRGATALATGTALAVGIGGLAEYSTPESPTSPTGIANRWGYNALGEVGNGGVVTPVTTPTVPKLPAGTTVSQLVEGYANSLAVTSSGSVYAWGDNTLGEMGNGTTSTTPVSTPAVVPGLSNITSVAVGYEDDMALSSTGQVYAWGANPDGEVGNGGTATTPTPFAVPVPGTVVTISAGFAHDLALTSTGAVYAWGLNTSGQLGIGSVVNKTTPTLVTFTGGPTITAIAAGYAASLAVTSTGAALSWGDNTDGELGNGTTTASNVPVPVSLPTGTTVSAVAGAYFSSMALTTSGGVLSWGLGTSGQLGNAATATSSVPVAAHLPAGITIMAISDEFGHEAALTSTGQIYAWGDNTYGELGNGTSSTTPSSTPGLVSLAADTKAIAIGTSPYSITNGAVLQNTTATTVSSSLNPALANAAVTLTAKVSPDDGGGTVAFYANGSTTPINGCGTAALALVSGVYQATCSTSTLATGNDPVTATYSGDTSYTGSSGPLSGGQTVTPPTTGVVVGYGANAAGQLGNGSTAANNPTPVSMGLPTGTRVTAVAAGLNHSLALTTSGQVYGVGDNTYGELGNGASSTTPVTAPVPVSLPAGTTITAISAGDASSLALSSTGTVYAWGINNAGQLGIGSSAADSTTPVAVTLPAGTVVTAISAGFAHNLALTSTGAIYAWGFGTSGQLGNGASATSTSPVLVKLPTGTTASAIAAGYIHSLAVTAAGAVLSWGDDTLGELGNGGTTASNVPVSALLPGGTTVSAVSAGYYESMALSASGGVFDWGYNGQGELGNATSNTVANSSPISVSLPTGLAVAISSEFENNSALTATGTVYTWGSNAVGELAQPLTVTGSTVPIVAALPSATPASAISQGAYANFNLDVVAPIATATSLASSANPSNTNQDITLTATVSPNDGGGSVAFSANGSPIAGCGSAALTLIAGSYRATCSTSTLATGNDPISATYSGDTLYLTSTGALAGGQTVNAVGGVAVGWGLNTGALLGTGTTANTSVPLAAKIPAGTTIAAVAPGTNSLALTSTGQVYGWGDNTYGELGNGTTSTTPVSTPTLASLPAGTVATAIAVGDDDAFALTSTGQVYAWGFNLDGELGIGSTTSASTPTLVTLPAGTVITAISAGFIHTLALTATGQAFAWGLNNVGQLGNPSASASVPTSTPVAVSVPAGTSLSAVSAGYDHSLALTTTGQVLAWGDNTYGELGNGATSTTAVKSPIGATLPAGVLASSVSASFNDSLAVSTTGTVLTWGENQDGQLGNGTTTTGPTPSAVTLPVGATAASAVGDGDHVSVLTSDGHLYAWGDNTYGELGNGTTSTTPVTSPVAGLIPAGSTVLAIGGSPLIASSMAVVTPVATTTTVTSSNGTSTYAQPVTFTATVSPIDGLGTLSFFADGSPTPIAGCGGLTPTLVSGTTYQATCTDSALSVGTHAISASYSGDGVHQSSSGTLAGGQSIVQSSTTLTLASTANPTAANQAASFTATINPDDAGGSVAFFADGSTTPITGCAAVAPAAAFGAAVATCDTSMLPAGSHTISATYSGDAGYLSSTGTLATTQVVTAAPAGVAAGFGLNNGGQLGNGTTTNELTPGAVALPAGTTVSADVGGYVHSLILTSGGSVFATGDNTYGELGNGTTSTTVTTTPVAVAFPAGTVITAIAVGYYDSLALSSTGQVFAWGLNNAGQLGNGTTTSADVPTPVSLPSGVTIAAIAAGYGHDLALSSTGQVYAWGLGASGQLGNAGTASSDSPVLVKLPGGITASAIAAGYAHSLAVTATGSVLAWGDNTDGELGNGATTSSSVPVAVTLPAGTSVTAVSAAYFTSQALTMTGGVLAWGVNNDGQLGNGTTATAKTPVAVALPAGTIATEVSQGLASGMALTSGGGIYAWGDNTNGELGDGLTASSSTPVAVSVPNGSMASGIGTSVFSESNLAIVAAVTTTTTVTSSLNPSQANQAVTFIATVSPANASGSVAFYADGSATPIAGCASAPLALSNGSYVATCSTSTLSAGSHTIAATYFGDGVHGSSSGTLASPQVVNPAASGVAVGFGYNSVGQLGDGTTVNAASPMAALLPSGTAFSAVAGGYINSLFLTTAGAVYASGDNTDGELGNGTTSTTATTTPVAVTFPSGTVITAIAVGYYDSLALSSTGQVYAWGLNTSGQLGNGTTTNADVPTLVSLPAGVVATAISAGLAHDLALTSTGRVYAWGADNFGQLGNGTTSTSGIPTPVLVHLPAGTSATAVAAGYAHSLAATATGGVVAWGDNTDGELGNGTTSTTPATTPVAVALPSGTVATTVSAAYFTSQSLTSAGTVLAWGLNTSGQLGNGTTTSSATPLAVALPSGTVATGIADELVNGLALTSGGGIYSWGANPDGELGDGSTVPSTTPVAVNVPSGSTAGAIGAGPYSASNLAIVTAVTTTTTVTSDLNPSQANQAVTFTATVSPANAVGTVAFSADGSPIAGCAAASLALSAGSYVATCSTSTLSVGSHGVSALYSGDGVHGSSSGTLASPQVVNPAPSGVAVGFGLNTSGQIGDGTAANTSTPLATLLPAGTTVTSVVGGTSNGLVLTTTGAVYAFGDDSDGQLGNGTTSTTPALTPVPVTFPGGTVITAIATGYLNNFALSSTGQVFAWGDNSDGQLGNTTTANATLPTPVSLPAGTVVTAIAAGFEHALALTSTGQIYAWGYNASGQLGNGSTTSVATPVSVLLPSGTSASAIAAGYAQSLAVTSSGSVLAWGDNTDGELGNGTTTSSTIPVAVSLPAGTSITSVSTAYFTSQALTSTGGVLAWGLNNDGQLGDGTTTTAHTPVAVALPSGSVATSASQGFASGAALTSAGQIFSWGDDTDGELGNGAASTTPSPAPAAVQLPNGSTASGVGMSSLSLTVLAIVSTVPTSTSVTSGLDPSRAGQAVTFTATVTPANADGTVSFFADGSLTAINGCASAPLAPAGLTFVATCSTSTLAPGSHTISATFNGDGVHQPSSGSLATAQIVTPVSGVAVGFGLNNDGQLGNGTSTTTVAVPVATLLPAGSIVTQVASGFVNSLILTTAGTVYAVGDNTYGELGNGTTSTTASTTPSLVSFPSGVTITAVAVGYYDSLALGSNGQVYAWGYNAAGELGNGTTTNQDSPTLVNLPSGAVATAISAGFEHDLALTASGSVYAWGLNTSGQLGNATITSSSSPVLVHLPANTSVSAVAAGYAQSLAVTSSGSLLAWGDNTEGELGNGTTTASAVPTAVSLPPGTTVTAVSAGYFASAALTAGGSVLDWGENNEGQLGNGSTTNSSVPVTVALPSGTVATTISDEYANGLATASTGQIYAWGYNLYGQLGNGTTTTSSLPVVVNLPAGSNGLAVGASPYSLSNLAVVSAVATTVTVTSSLNPSVYGQSVTFTAAVAPSNGLGTVNFSADSTTLSGCGAVALVAVGTSYEATCTTTTLSAGTHSIVAAYSGDGVHLGGSGTLAGGQVVSRAPTTTTVTTSANPVTYPNAVTFSAAVSPDDGGGTVAFFLDGSATPVSGCAAVPLSLVGANEVATCTTSGLSGGTHTVAATYSGDTDFAPSSGTLAGGQRVVVATHLVTSAVAVVKSLTTLSTTFTATLTTLPANTPLPGQPVLFSVGSTYECTGTTNSQGVASCTVSLAGVIGVILNLGSTATYQGTAVYLPSSATAPLQIGVISASP